MLHKSLEKLYGDKIREAVSSSAPALPLATNPVVRGKMPDSLIPVQAPWIVQDNAVLKPEFFLSATAADLQKIVESAEAKFGASAVKDSLFADDFKIYQEACAAGDHPLMKRLVYLAKKFGSQTLVEEMIASRDYESIRSAIRNKDKLAVALILNILDDNKRQEALRMVPAVWDIFHLGRKMRLDEVWQDIGGGQKRWLAVTNNPPLYKDLARQSPYKFKQKLFEQILPEISAACAAENCESKAVLIAYKLAVIFTNTQEIDRYFLECNRQNNGFSIISATSFEIPVRGLWSVDYWRTMLLQYGAGAAECLEYAPRIEKLAAKSGSGLPKSLSALRVLQRQAFYRSRSVCRDFAAAASANGIDSDYYNRALSYIRKHGKRNDLMPDVFIDGVDIGYPNYYFMKVHSRDPLLCLLGSINNHSQHLENDAGKYTIPHIVASAFAGAYVLKKKTKGRITASDLVAADMLAYITEQNTILFDGIGAKDSATNASGPPSESDKRVHVFLEQFAFDVIGKHKFSAVRSKFRKNVETVLPSKIRNDADQLYVEGVRLGDDKDWVDYLGHGHRQIAAEDFGQFFIPQDKKLGWMHNESQDHQLLISPRSHRAVDKIAAGEPDQSQVQMRALEQEAKDYLVRTVEKLAVKYGIEVRIGAENKKLTPDYSGADTSISLWTLDGKPLTTVDNDNFSALTKIVTKGMLDVERMIPLMFRQNVRDFARSNSKNSLSPQQIYAADTESRLQAGSTLAILRRNHVVSIETRMAGVDANYHVVMAGAIAGVARGLDIYSRIVTRNKKYPATKYEIINTGNVRLAVHRELTATTKKYTGWSGHGYQHRKKSYVGKYPQDIYPLPVSREEALQSLMANGSQNFAGSALGINFLKALVRQQAPASLHEKFDVMRDIENKGEIVRPTVV